MNNYLIKTIFITMACFGITHINAINFDHVTLVNKSGSPVKHMKVHFKVEVEHNGKHIAHSGYVPLHILETGKKMTFNVKDARTDKNKNLLEHFFPNSNEKKKISIPKISLGRFDYYKSVKHIPDTDVIYITLDKSNSYILVTADEYKNSARSLNYAEPASE